MSKMALGMLIFLFHLSRACLFSVSRYANRLLVVIFMHFKCLLLIHFYLMSMRIITQWVSLYGLICLDQVTRRNDIMLDRVARSNNVMLNITPCAYLVCFASPL